MFVNKVVYYQLSWICCIMRNFRRKNYCCTFKKITNLFHRENYTFKLSTEYEFWKVFFELSLKQIFEVLVLSIKSIEVLINFSLKEWESF